MENKKKKLVFATNNKHKLDEARAILGDAFDVVSLSDIDCHDEIPETADTLEGNALIKARWVKDRYGCDCFADDTGLMVDALGGAPGVYSARYAGEHCSFADNVNKMLREMKGKSNRKAYFATVIALILNGETRTFEGRVDGSIATEPHGDGGFGYDPIFIAEETGSSFAEMSPEEKNAISHRGRALRKMAVNLLGIFIMLLLPAVMMAETAVLTPGILPALIDDWKSTSPTTLQLTGEATALDLASLKNLPASVETLDMSSLKVKGIKLNNSNYLGQSEFSDGELPPYSLFSTNIRNLTLPASLAKIGEAAFAETPLSAVSIPSGVNYIGARAFYKCTSLKTADLSATAISCIPEQCFYGCTSLTNAMLPASVRVVGKQAFMQSGITAVNLPNTSQIGDYAFAEMPALSQVSIHYDASLGEGAFFGDGLLSIMNTTGSDSASLSLANSGAGKLVGSISGETVDEGAYANTKADTIVLHPSVKEIKSHAFRNATNLKAVDVSELGQNIPAVAEDAFSGVDVGKVLLTVREDNMEAWKAATVWQDFKIGKSTTGVETVDDVKIDIHREGNKISVISSHPIASLSVWSISGMTLLETSPKQNNYIAGPFDASQLLVRVVAGNVTKLVKLL